MNKRSPIPLYYQLKELLKEQIEKGEIKSGDKLPSEAEMIRKYKIGRLTIREALAQLVNEGYLEKQQGKGTFCRGIPQQEGRSIHVLLNTSDTYFIPYYIRGINEVLSANHANFIFYDTRDNADEIAQILETLLQKETAGIIIQASEDTGRVPLRMGEALGEFKARGIPYIFLDHRYDALDASHVSVDYVKGGFIGAEHLIRLGHKKICGIFIRGNKESRDRKKGFLQACLQYGLNPADVRMLYMQRDESRFESELLSALGGRDGATALVCFNDSVAIKCMGIARRNGFRIPEDISITGFDDTFLAETAEIPLTSISHPKDALAGMAAEKLLGAIRGVQDWPFGHVFEPGLTIRKSTGSASC